MNAQRRGPFGLVGDDGLPLCEECDIQMHPYAGKGADGMSEGYACMGCGWSFEASLSLSTVFPDVPEKIEDPFEDTLYRRCDGTRARFKSGCIFRCDYMASEPGERVRARIFDKRFTLRLANSFYATWRENEERIYIRLSGQGLGPCAKRSRRLLARGSWYDCETRAGILARHYDSRRRG